MYNVAWFGEKSSSLHTTLSLCFNIITKLKKQADQKNTFIKTNQIRKFQNEVNFNFFSKNTK